MNCTKEEAALVLAKWFANSSPLLLNLQAAPSPQVVCFRGCIFELAEDSFLFKGVACSISVPLKSATFEYEEVPDSMSVADEQRLSAIPCLRLRLPLATSTQEKNDAATVASSILSITEAVR
jgi:hypothetical protein